MLPDKETLTETGTSTPTATATVTFANPWVEVEAELADATRKDPGR